MLDKSLALGLVKGESLFSLISPKFPKCIKPSILKKAIIGFLIGWRAEKMIKVYNSKEEFEKIPTELLQTLFASLFSHFVGGVLFPVYIQASKTRRPLIKKNGMGGRTWLQDNFPDKRTIKQMKIIFHDANKAGRHIDIHIGHLSLIIGVKDKPVEKAIKFNAKGELTAKAKELLLEHVREEIYNNSRVVQNLDHSKTNAAVTWNIGGKGLKGYGAGPTRQTILNEDVEIMSVDKGSGKTIKMYSPTINKHGLLFIHKLYPGNKKKAPIVIFGKIKKGPPNFDDRLHLIMKQDIKKFLKLIDPKTATRKYDGASVHFDANKKETIFWSPRISKETEERIQYSQKVPELFRIGHNVNPRGMGELMFREAFNPLNPKHWFNKDRYLSAAEIGGILNSNKLRPRNVIPDFRIYRMDHWNGENVGDLPFFENRILQKAFAKLSKFINVVELAPVKFNKNWEGLVAIPPGESIKNGYKLKWWGDAQDWAIESNELKFGETGKIAGVIWFRSLDSGKRFKLGPGQLGKEAECLDLMKQGNKIVGRVAKVKSRRGHEGRAAKLVEWHLDKGVG